MYSIQLGSFQSWAIKTAIVIFMMVGLAAIKPLAGMMGEFFLEMVRVAVTDPKILFTTSQGLRMVFLGSAIMITLNWTCSKCTDLVWHVLVQHFVIFRFLNRRALSIEYKIFGRKINALPALQFGFWFLVLGFIKILP